MGADSSKKFIDRMGDLMRTGWTVAFQPAQGGILCMLRDADQETYQANGRDALAALEHAVANARDGVSVPSNQSTFAGLVLATA